jgi:predicted glycogen debranching enzyme
VFVYEAAGVDLQKSVFMVHGENTTVVQYELRGTAQIACTLELRPLIAFRDYHSTTHENAAINRSLVIAPGLVKSSPYPGCPDLYFAHTTGEVRQTGDWYRNFEYTIEQERGLDFREDLFNPVVISFDLKAHPPAAVVASTEVRAAQDVERLRDAEIDRLKDIGASAESDDPFRQLLVQAADQFIVQRGEGSTIIAGYPWFTDWGRDTMIALRGLALCTRRFDDARAILVAFAGAVDRGMLPNRFTDAGESAEYNTADATLWYFEAVRAFLEHTQDGEFVRTRLYPVLTDIIAWHERGTRYGIRVDSDALVLAGEAGTQLTWMDAKVGDRAVTPRQGKPVEIQALWYNALRVMEELSGDGHYKDLADRARESFIRLFWNGSTGCLYDVVDGERRDPSIRPNQIFAVSLFHSMLSFEQMQSVLAVVGTHLLTPYGLRTLAASDLQYRGRFEDGPESRDSAYHQGTVWPWLVGPYLSAYFKVNGRSADAIEQASRRLAEFRRYIAEDGVGQIPEVFDSDAPHRAGGCTAQAWSVAELLRIVMEELEKRANSGPSGGI